MAPSDKQSDRLRESVNRIEREVSSMLEQMKASREKMEEIHSILKGDEGLLTRVIVLWDRAERSQRWMFIIGTLSLTAFIGQFVQWVMRK